MSVPNWTKDQILQQAQGNANAMTAAILLYVQETGQSVEDFAAFVAEKFAPGWNEVVGKGALTIAQVAVFNPVSLGATMVSLDGDDDHATAVFDVSAMDEFISMFGVPSADIETMWRIFMGRMADFLNIGFDMQRNGSQWTFEFTY